MLGVVGTGGGTGLLRSSPASHGRTPSPASFPGTSQGPAWGDVLARGLADRPDRLPSREGCGYRQWGQVLASPATWLGHMGRRQPVWAQQTAYRAPRNFSPHIFPIKKHLDTNRSLAEGPSGSTGCFPRQQPSPRAGLGGEGQGRP